MPDKPHNELSYALFKDVSLLITF